jgi:hypothetical protein
MKRFARAVVTAGLIALAAGGARAGNVTISNGRTTPVESATADGTSTGDITITSGGAVSVGTGPAVTLNSNNAINNQGTIAVTSDTNAVAVLLEAGNSGSFSSSGDINALIDDSDDIATGSGNIAFWVSGNGAFIGNISFTSASTVKVGGASSAGLLLDAQIQGTIDIAGDVTADGTAAVGLESNALITGNLTIESAGSIIATGDGARALLIAGGIDGAFKNGGTIGVVGAQTNATYSSDAPRADFSVGIGASLTGGFQNTGSINASSAGLGLFISPTLGTTPSDITLGVINATSMPYGFENEGTISAAIARMGETVTGLSIKGTNINGIDYGVTIDGGIKNAGTINASRTADGAAIGMELGYLATTPTILNSGSITGTTSSSGSSSAYGLLLQASANLASLDNSGTVSATATALDATAYGIVDLSGTLLSMNNSGKISATATTTDSDTGSTSAIAMDLSHAQDGVTLTDSGTITGNVLLGAHDDVVSLIDDGDDDDTTTSTWTGSIDFGDGNDTFAISGDGVFTGSTTKGAGMLAITVDDGVLAIGSDSTIVATSIDFTSDSRLTLIIDPDLAATPRLAATDSITFANGATIDATLEDFVLDGFTTVIARAPTIQASLSSTDLVFENLPYLYGAEAEIVSGSEQELDLVFHLKTSAELGLNANETAFYASLIDILGVDDNVLAEPFLAISSADDFAKAYPMLMPATSQPTLRANLATTDDIERNLQDRAGLFLKGDNSFDAINAWWAGSGRAYALDANESSKGIDGSVVSTTFGVDRMFIPWLMVGAEVTFAGSDLFDAGSDTNVVHVSGAQGGLYATLSAGPFYVSGSAGGGSTSNHGTCVFKTDDNEVAISDAWDGTFLNAAAEAGINGQFNHLTLRPWVGLSWLNLSEEAHQESGGGTGFDLAYDEIEADIERAKAGLTIAYTFNYPQVQMTPELRAAWSQLLSDVPSELHGSFVDGSVPFILTGAPIPHDQVTAGFGLMLHGKGLAVSLGYDAMFADGETSHSGKMEISTQF